MRPARMVPLAILAFPCISPYAARPNAQSQTTPRAQSAAVPNATAQSESKGKAEVGAPQTGNPAGSGGGNEKPAPTQAASGAKTSKSGATKAASPKIILSQSSGAPGSRVIITGKGFGDNKSTVEFNGVQADVDAWSDTSITAVVPTTLAPGIATVTVTPLSGRSQTASFTVIAPVIRFGTVFGIFAPFLDQDNKIVNPPPQADVLSKDLVVIGKVKELNFIPPNKMEIFYTLDDPKAVPAWVLVGKKSPGDHSYPFTSTNDTSLVDMEQAIWGDFCLPDKPLPGGQCTTGLVSVNPETGQKESSKSPSVSAIRAYLQADDNTSRDATLTSINVNIANIKYTAPSTFKPAWLVLEVSSGAHRFSFSPAPPLRVTPTVYTADDLEKICNKSSTAQDKKKSPGPDGEKTPGPDQNSSQGQDREQTPGPDTNGCANTNASNVVLKPIASDSTATLVAVHIDDKGKLLDAEVRAPIGLEPTAILATNVTNKPPTSVVVRRTLKPGQNTNLLQIDMTIMDQETADRNYGDRIGKRYLAVQLDVKNPTSKKLQFNKSAVYFDVDYIQAERNKYQDFEFQVLTGSTLGLYYNPLPYSPPFKKAKNGRVFRFGLEQNVKHSPIGYLSVLGSYDETTERAQQEFDTLQLLASVMNTIATGGIAGGPSFRSASSILSGVFLPGLKGIVLNDSRINRHRANIVAQTLQEVIQVPGNSSVPTIVLLPRTGILDFMDAQISVMIQRVIDVHVETEVVTPVTEAPVEKGACKVGYTKDQTRDALGEPAGVTTNSDGTSTFTYPKGPVAAASFNAGGSLTNCQQRSVTDQLGQATTFVEFNKTLATLNLTSTHIGLTDGSIVVTDVPGVTQSFHFDAKGNVAKSYTLLFPDIKSKVGAKKSDFDSYLETQAQTLSATRSSDIKAEAEAASAQKTAATIGKQVQYKSPDVANGFVMVTFKNSDPTSKNTVVSDASIVDQVSFQGDKPSGLD